MTPETRTDPADMSPAQRNIGGLPVWLHRVVVGSIVTLMAIEAALLAFQEQWLSAATLLAFVVLTLLPTQFGRFFRISLPLDFQVAAVLFMFAALFLGEMRDFYFRVWWWDSLLHFTSGILLGLFGFVLAYAMNEDDRIDLHLKPSFMATFAFFFALSVGALWEIFEFAMDQIFGMQMQKPKFGDLSGLTDTMLDLILDALGGLVISVFGWRVIRRRNGSLVEAMIARFVARNPHLFRRRTLRRRKNRRGGR